MKGGLCFSDDLSEINSIERMLWRLIRMEAMLSRARRLLILMGVKDLQFLPLSATPFLSPCKNNITAFGIQSVIMSKKSLSTIVHLIEDPISENFLQSSKLIKISNLV